MVGCAKGGTVAARIARTMQLPTAVAAYGPSTEAAVTWPSRANVAFTKTRPVPPHARDADATPRIADATLSRDGRLGSAAAGARPASTTDGRAEAGADPASTVACAW